VPSNTSHVPNLQALQIFIPSHREPLERLVDGGFAVPEGSPDLDVRDQTGHPPVVKLTDFDPKVFSGFLFSQKAVIGC